MEVKEVIKKTTLITLTTLFITHTIAYFPYLGKDRRLKTQKRVDENSRQKTLKTQKEWKQDKKKNT
jgi:hypothetical protein